MKFSKILLLLVIAISIVSCKSDDDAPGAFILSNGNLAGTHDLTYFTSNLVITGDVGGQTITVTTNTVADTYQVEVVFTEAGTYTIDGEFRTTTTSSLGTPPQVEIVVVNETGTYQVNAAAQTIVFIQTGSTLGDSDINTVTLFNETDLRVTYEDTYTVDGDEISEMTELRFVKQ
tara:strand:- start:536 stop:1060 length:525 start_codon:yes stop_codon:yes gene_type:complete